MSPLFGIILQMIDPEQLVKNTVILSDTILIHQLHIAKEYRAVGNHPHHVKEKNIGAAQFKIDQSEGLIVFRKDIVDLRVVVANDRGISGRVILQFALDAGYVASDLRA